LPSGPRRALILLLIKISDKNIYPLHSFVASKLRSYEADHV